MQHVKDAIFQEITKAKQKAIDNGYEIPRFSIRFDLKGTCAGRAGYKGQEYYLRFNLDIAKDNLETFLARTVNHELAHLLQFKYNRGCKPHGSEWQYYNRVLTGKKMPRCHSYDVSHLKTRNVKRYIYTCGCTQHVVSSIKHNRILKGGGYRCIRCRNELKAV
jgi:SprT protein